MKFDDRGLANVSLPPDFNLRREAWLVIYAQESCQIAESFCKLLLNPMISEESMEYLALINTIYIVYGRPFRRCNGIGFLDKTDIPASEYELHEQIMIFRDKIYGHKDSDGVQLGNYNANEVRLIAKDKHLRFFCTELYTRPPKISDIQKHIFVLSQYFSVRLDDIVAKLLPVGKFPNGDYILDGQYVLSVNRHEASAFKKVPLPDTYVPYMIR